MDMTILLVFVIIIGVQMFFGMKRQKQQAQEAKNMMDSLAPGVSIVTIGGLHGVVAEVHDTTVVIDCEGVYLTFERRAIARITNTTSTQVSDLYPEETENAVVEEITDVD